MRSSLRARHWSAAWRNTWLHKAARNASAPAPQGKHISSSTKVCQRRLGGFAYKCWRIREKYKLSYLPLLMMECTVFCERDEKSGSAFRGLSCPLFSSINIILNLLVLRVHLCHKFFYFGATFCFLLSVRYYIMCVQESVRAFVCACVRAYVAVCRRL